MEGAFQANAFQNDAFQVIPLVRTVGNGELDGRIVAYSLLGGRVSIEPMQDAIVEAYPIESGIIH